MGGEEKLAGVEYNNHQLIDTHTMHFNAIMKHIKDKEVVEKYSKDIKVLYCAFHGAGKKAGPRTLRALGFPVDIIEAMHEPDGTFPEFDDDEDIDPALVKSWEKAIEAYLKDHKRDDLLKMDLPEGGDPDADRIGVVTRVSADEIPENEAAAKAMGIVVKLTKEEQKRYGYGALRVIPPNEWNVLIAFYDLSRLKAEGKLDTAEQRKKYFLVTTHVTSVLMQKIADYFGIECIVKPVGVDQLADEIVKLEAQGRICVNGSEESGTYMTGQHIRDKDGFLGGLRIAEIACYARSLGKTINDILDEIYLIPDIGFCASTNNPIVYEVSVPGTAAKMAAVRFLQTEVKPLVEDMVAEGNNPVVAGYKIYAVDEQIPYRSGKYDEVLEYPNYPDAGIRLYFNPEKTSYITIRPSGTGPQLRFYVHLHYDTQGLNRSELNSLKKEAYVESLKVTEEWIKIIETKEAIFMKSDGNLKKRSGATSTQASAGGFKRFRGSAQRFIETLQWRITRAGDTITAIGIQSQRDQYEKSHEEPEGIKITSVRNEIEDLEKVGILRRTGEKDINGRDLYQVLVDPAVLAALPDNIKEMLGRGRIRDEEIGTIQREIAKVAKLQMTPAEVMKDLKFLMDILGLKEYGRQLGISKTSLDSVAFIENLIEASGRSEDEVLKAVMSLPHLRSRALKYKVRKAMLGEGIDPKESTCESLRIDVGKDGSKISKDSKVQLFSPGILSDFLKEQFANARDTLFAYRDDMYDYLRRFMEGELIKSEYYRQTKINGKELSDLQDSVDTHRKFLTSGKINLKEISNLINNGIGANEMYLHQYARMINQLADELGIDFHWEVVDNPADFGRVMENCKNPTTENTLAYDMSRSGGTTEPADFMEMTCKKEAGLYINKRIVWANKGRFHKLGSKLAERDPDAAVLHIDNTPGNIGGRHMNLKTDMVYGPLFTALTILGYKMFNDELGVLNWATLQLKSYVENLYSANENLSPKQKSENAALYNPASQIASEMVRKRDVEGRVKLAMVFDPGLRHFATEYFQNTNEGIAKPAKGAERNNNMHSFWDASNEKLDYVSVFKARPELYQPIFIVDLSSRYADKMLKEADALKEAGIPIKVVTLDLKQVEKGDKSETIKEKFEHNLAVQAQATTLLQTVVTTFSHLTDQDANSNPAVKMTREVTAAIQDILVARRNVLGRDLNENEKTVTFAEILKKMKETKEKNLREARRALFRKSDEVKARGEEELPEAFQDFIDNTLLPLAKGLGMDEKEVARIFIGSLSRNVFSADTAESGGLKSALMDAALETINSGTILGLGSLTEDFELESLSNQVVAFKDDSSGLMVSLACPEGLSKEKVESYTTGSFDELPQAIADYYYDRFQEGNRGKTLNTFGIGYIDADTGNENIDEIMTTANDLSKDFGINALGMNFPRIAHTGIEAAQALAEIIAIIGLIPSQTFPEGRGQLGSVEIREGLTVNDANKVYVLSNVSRMAFGGSPTVILEYKNKEQLGEIKDVMVKALGILAGKIDTAFKADSQQAAAKSNEQHGDDYADTSAGIVYSGLPTEQAFCRYWVEQTRNEGSVAPENMFSILKAPNTDVHELFEDMDIATFKAVFYKDDDIRPDLLKAIMKHVYTFVVTEGQLKQKGFLQKLSQTCYNLTPDRVIIIVDKKETKEALEKVGFSRNTVVGVLGEDRLGNLDGVATIGQLSGQIGFISKANPLPISGLNDFQACRLDQVFDQNRKLARQILGAV